MGQGCTKCSVGNPCTDPKCQRYGSRHLQRLVEQVRDKLDDLQESVRTDEQNNRWLENLDRKFEEKTRISADGYRYFANNVREYFNTPQPKIDELDNVEYRLLVCLDSHTHGEYLECSSYAQDLTKLATAGRDPPAHCKGKSGSYTCTLPPLTSTLGETTGNGGGGGGGGGGADARSAINGSKPQSFGSCYS